MAASGYKYVITKRARQDLDVLPVTIQKRIRNKLLFFIDSNNPMQFAQRLTDYKDGDYKFRVGVYRIVFDKQGTTLYILRVQHRREVYKR